MVIPQFSIRWLLAVTAVCAVVFSIFGLAVRGQLWAVGVSVAVLSLVVAMLVYAALFAGVWVFSLLLSLLPGGKHRAGDSPFRQVPFAQASPSDPETPATPILLLLLCLAGASGTAAGATGGLHQTTGNGLSLAVDTRWLDGPGYRPVRVSVTPLAPVAADRTLRIEFLVARQYHGGGYDLRVQQDIEIPAGSGPSTPITATLSVPEYAGWAGYSINVFEDGQIRQRLCTAWTGVNNIPNGFGQHLPAILIITNATGAPPDTGQLASVLPTEKYSQYGQYSQYGTSAPASPSSGLQQLPSVESLSPADLPRRWIDYSSLDVVCLSVERLADLRANHPAAMRAITQWTAAGGNLWVYDLGADWQRLGQIEDLLGLPSGDAGKDDSKARGWQEPSKGLYGRAARDLSPYSKGSGAPSDPYMVEETMSATVAPADPGTPALATPNPPQRSPFLHRPLGLGMITAMAAADPWRQNNPEWKSAEWNWLLVSLGPDRWLWCQRHGLSFARENEEFWNFLIPGVGLAPVAEFCILITLFVLAIGPLNYWLLRRWKRLHLLVVTIPGSAAAVTLVLFTYAVLADGLGTRVRVRSVTEIDQRRGQAVCWSRTSYYAGLAPGRGLAFPDDVAVFPFEEEPMAHYYDRPQGRELIWEDDQRFAAGWLNSRTPTQFITVRSRPADCGLQVSEPADGSGKLEIRNRLGSRIEQLVVQSHSGRCYWTADVEPDATHLLDPIAPDKAAAQMLRACQANQPAYPPGMELRGGSGFLGMSGRRSYYRYRYMRWGSSDPAPTQLGSRLESTLGSIAGSSSRLPPGSYVAVVDRSPEVELGTPSAREESSLHVILGKW